MAAGVRLKGAARAFAATLVGVALAGCVAHQPAHWQGARAYTVQPHDTLYSIAFRHGVDWRDLARWNGIDGPGYLIRPGDVLQLHGATAAAASGPTGARTTAAQPPQAQRSERPLPATTRATTAAATAGVSFRWPADGELIARFNDGAAAGKGIAIAGSRGQTVMAAAPGRVVYTGSGLIGYGELIIVKHNNQLLSAYAHNREILVQEGDEVSAGQRIATMGEGPGRRTMLHFEIRIDGQAVDPLQHLPPRQ